MGLFDSNKRCEQPRERELERIGAQVEALRAQRTLLQTELRKLDLEETQLRYELYRARQHLEGLQAEVTASRWWLKLMVVGILVALGFYFTRV